MNRTNIILPKSYRKRKKKRKPLGEKLLDALPVGSMAVPNINGELSDDLTEFGVPHKLICGHVLLWPREATWFVEQFEGEAEIVCE